MWPRRAHGGVTLTSDDLETVLGILERIDQGLTEPRFPDRIGRFLRQYRSGQPRVNAVLAQYGIRRRADAAVSGHSLEPVEIHAILEPKVSLRGFPLGEVGETIAISEELGGVANVVMWLKGPVANAAYNMFRENPGVRLSGDYRWSPLARVTPGEARVEVVRGGVNWQTARCMKAVADDLLRPPDALEYVLDYRLGPPGIKYFRCVCALRAPTEWRVLPALGEPRGLPHAPASAEVRKKLGTIDELATLLIYREPWSNDWTIVDALAINPDHAYAHAVSWADFQKELDGSATDGSIIRGIRESLSECGLRPSGFPEANLDRKLLPVVRDVLRSLR